MDAKIRDSALRVVRVTFHHESSQRAAINALVQTDPMGKKRKLEATAKDDVSLDTSKPTAVFRSGEGRPWTLSVALPGTVVVNAQSRELQALLTGQIARALAVFCVDEIVIFDDGQFQPPPAEHYPNHGQANGDYQEALQNTYTGYTDPGHFLAHVLSYLECPPYLRQALFPRHPNFQHAGMLPSLDMPHHLKKHEWCEYREGVTRPTGEGTSWTQDGNTRRDGPDNRTSVNTGLAPNILLAGNIPNNTRVTVKFAATDEVKARGESIEATPVAPSAPRTEKGLFWGYTVRTADSLSKVITECPFEGGYDLTFGTSERGIPLSDIQTAKTALPVFNHMMIVFGGVAGLEVAVEADDELKELNVTSPEKLFDYWVNLVPGQGSRTIRTEEAVWLGLMGLRDVAVTHGRK